MWKKNLFHFKELFVERKGSVIHGTIVAIKRLLLFLYAAIVFRIEKKSIS